MLPLLLGLVALALLLVFALTRCMGSLFAGEGNGGASSQNAAAASASAASTGAGDDAATRVSFIAVGDNVPNDILGEFADAQAGEVGDGVYDYRPLFSQVKPYVQAADLSYIDQEVHVGGNEIGPQGYPSFNTTDEMADAVVDAGFDLVASATNHAFDYGFYGAVEHSREVWNAKPVAFTGTATSYEEANEIPVVERKGIRFALINYTYGLNGIDIDEYGSFYVNIIDEDRIKADVARAREQADVVIAAMHWGDENVTEPNDQELELSQLLANWGVDIIVGSHPHVIQPMTWLTGTEGNKTLVCYSLGNFIIQHADPTHDNDLEGMLSCDFVRKSEGGEVTIENIKWIPMVYHGVEGEYSVWPLKDYPDELAKRNPAYTDLKDPKQWLLDRTNTIVNYYGDNFEIDGAEKHQ